MHDYAHRSLSRSNLACIATVIANASKGTYGLWALFSNSLYVNAILYGELPGPSIKVLSIAIRKQKVAIQPEYC